MINRLLRFRPVAKTRDDIARLHAFVHWPAKKLWPLIIVSLALSVVAARLPGDYWPVLLLVWAALGTILFVFVLTFHDASHDRLHPVRWMNDAIGHLMGSLMFIPLDVYRHAHARHHAYLCTRKDPELWPFNEPSAPRWLRVLAALCEIVLGAVYSPFLFLRSVLQGDLVPGERALIIRGYLGCAATWGFILFAAYEYDLWRLLVVMALVPMAISGALQTLNKYMQHLGLHGRTVLGLTRTVVDEHEAGELVSSAMFYNDYHGTHHRYARIPYYNLPAATPYTLAGASEFCPVYPNLAYAFFAMLPHLADPKAGPQWIAETVAEPHFDRPTQNSPTACVASATRSEPAATSPIPPAPFWIRQTAPSSPPPISSAAP
jgi:fatty acid desaturase